MITEFRSRQMGGMDPDLRARERPTALAAVLTAIVSVPLWCVSYPPLYDYPFHLARLLVLHDLWNAGPLSKYYEINSFIIPNVAMDVIGMALQAFLKVEDAGRIFLSLTIFLLIAGAGFLSRTLFGRAGYAPWAAALLIFNWVFTSGFINYLFALALLPWAIGLFIRTRHRSAALRLACGTAICFGLFFSHLVVFAFYVLAAMALEVQWAVPLLRSTPMKVVNRAIVAGLPIVAVFAVFLLQSPTAHAAGSPITYDGFQSALGFIRYKLLWPIRALSSDDAVVDWVSAAVVVAVAILVARQGSVWTNRELLVAIAFLAVVYWIAPGHLFSAEYVDMRIPLGAFLLLAASTEVRIDGARARVVTIVLLGLLAFRSAAIARDWIALKPVEQRITAAFRCLPPQSILFAAQTDPALLGSSSPPLGHFVSIAEITNRAFVPATWAHPAQQPISVKPAYADIYAFQTPQPRMITEGAALREFATEIHDLLAYRLAAGQDDFGGNVYLLYMFPERLGHPSIRGARVVADQELFTLYRLPSGTDEGRKDNVVAIPGCSAS